MEALGVRGRVQVNVVDEVNLAVGWIPSPSWFLCKELASHSVGTGKATHIPAVSTEDLSLEMPFLRAPGMLGTALRTGALAPNTDLRLPVRFAACCGAGVRHLQGRTCGGRRLAWGRHQLPCFIPPV